MMARKISSVKTYIAQRYPNARWNMSRPTTPLYLRAPYGIVRVTDENGARIDIDKEKAGVIKVIYRYYIDGMTLSQIGRELCRRHIMTPGGKQTWRIGTLYRILFADESRLWYLGCMAVGHRSRDKRVILSYASHPAILTPELCIAVDNARTMATHGRGGARNTRPRKKRKESR